AVSDSTRSCVRPYAVSATAGVAPPSFAPSARRRWANAARCAGVAMTRAASPLTRPCWHQRATTSTRSSGSRYIGTTCSPGDGSSTASAHGVGAILDIAHSPAGLLLTVPPRLQPGESVILLRNSFLSGGAGATRRVGRDRPV